MNIWVFQGRLLKQAAIDTKLLGPNMVGLTLGHAVLVCPGYANDVSRLSTSFIMSNGMSKQNQFQHFFSCIFNNQQSELIIHRPDGRIRDKDSHGKNSFPPKG